SGKLLNADGSLAQRGYANSLVLEYDRNAIKANKARIKEWDYYLITNDDYAIALTVDDNGYMGLISASVLDFKNQTEKTTSVVVPFPMGKLKMPPTSSVGDVQYKNDRVDFLFKNYEGSRRLKITFNKFDGNESLMADIMLTDEPLDSMVIATPFSENKKAFYYNQKIIGMRASGMMQYKGNTYEFNHDSSFGMLDWGRGVWTYDNTWFWGAGQGIADGKVFGFNIGYGFGDTSAASENMVFFDGKAHKLEGVSFNIPKYTNGADNYMSPWTFTSTDGRFEMKFQPILDRSAVISVGVMGSDQHQVFGKFTGTAVLDDGTKIHIENFLGFAEKVRNKW
ncbi:MAG: DUF2804 domain-containing protein, partial [Oscillospiraceae bacterium]